MSASQCLGRLVRDVPKGTWMLGFEDGSLFHIPIRCNMIATNGDLCDSCKLKEQKTIEKVKSITGTTIKGTLPSYLNGRVTEPIPFWSRLYDGAWFRLRIESGYTVSEETMVKARAAAAKAYAGVQTVEPEPMPGARKVRSKAKVAAEAAPVPVAVAVPVPVAAPVTVAPVAPAPKKRGPKKVAPTPTTEAVAVVPTPSIELDVESVKKITVRKTEVEDRSVYLDPRTEKLYDLKFKYIGRLKDGKIHSFPDSDQD